MIIIELLSKCNENDLYFIIGAINAKILEFMDDQTRIDFVLENWDK